MLTVISHDRLAANAGGLLWRSYFCVAVRGIFVPMIRVHTVNEVAGPFVGAA